MSTTPKRTPWYRRLVALAELQGDTAQQDIAERLGVSPGAVSGWKEGRPPKPESVKAAARAYGADYTELLLIAYPPDDDESPRMPQPRNPRKPKRPL